MTISKSLKIILGALVGLVILIAVALLFFVDANVYKPRLFQWGQTRLILNDDITFL